MLRPFKIVLLAMGAVLGYGFALHGMRHHRYERDSFEQHVADVCTRAANRVRGESPGRTTEKPTSETADP